MKLRNVHVDNKKLNNAEIDFFDPIKMKIRDRTVIVGKNGSGKTTLLEVIYSLIELMESGVQGLDNVQTPIFSPAGVKAVLEFTVPHQMQFNVLSGVFPFAPQDDLIMDHSGGDGHLYVVSGNQDTLDILQTIRLSTAGIEENPLIGNLLYFPTDRSPRFSKTPLKGELVNESPRYQWTYKYDPSHDQWKGSLESFLCWLHYRDLRLKLNKFDEFKSMVNQFLEGKTIADVSLDYRVEVRDLTSGDKFGLDALSSGEKQIVLLLGEIFRHIRHGSIVMIDEPELHLHPVWQRIFVDTLTQLCKNHDAQLIMTTQSPKIAEFVGQREVVELDDLLEESGS